MAFDFRHDRRAGPEVMDELGRVVLNVCGAVPDGVVLFFPSYSYEETVQMGYTIHNILCILL